MFSERSLLISQYEETQTQILPCMQITQLNEYLRFLLLKKFSAITLSSTCLQYSRVFPFESTSEKEIISSHDAIGSLSKERQDSELKNINWKFLISFLMDVWYRNCFWECFSQYNEKDSIVQALYMYHKYPVTTFLGRSPTSVSSHSNHTWTISSSAFLTFFSRFGSDAGPDAGSAGVTGVSGFAGVWGFTGVCSPPKLK